MVILANTSGGQLAARTVRGIPDKTPGTRKFRSCNSSKKSEAPSVLSRYCPHDEMILYRISPWNAADSAVSGAFTAHKTG